MNNISLHLYICYYKINHIDLLKKKENTKYYRRLTSNLQQKIIEKKIIYIDFTVLEIFSSLTINYVNYLKYTKINN